MKLYGWQGYAGEDKPHPYGWLDGSGVFSVGVGFIPTRIRYVKPAFRGRHHGG